MAAGDILTVFQAQAAFTITLGSLANAAARQSTLLNNSANNYPAAMVYARIQSGTAPTAGTIYEIYLIRGNGSYRSDNAGASDAAITIQNASLLGSIVLSATANFTFRAEFSTESYGPLGPEWGIAIVNQSGQALNASGHNIDYAYYYPQAQ